MMHKLVAVDCAGWDDLVGRLVASDRSLVALRDRHGRTPLGLACVGTRRALLFDNRYELEPGMFWYDGNTCTVAFATDLLADGSWHGGAAPGEAGGAAAGFRGAGVTTRDDGPPRRAALTRAPILAVLSSHLNYSSSSRTTQIGADPCHLVLALC